MRRLLRKPVTWVALAVVVAGLVVGLALFEPWRAFTSSYLDESAPVAAPTKAADTDVSTGTSTSTTPAQPVVLAEGAFVSQEHDTAGTARVFELPTGERVLRLEG